jgi:thymidylate synthase (FAD)
MALTPEQLAEIESMRAREQPTRRAVVSALEDILYLPLPVLDHGFVRVIDYMGDDAAIVQAARVSYGHGTRHISSDRGLIGYLMRHRHTSPFEMCELKLHVKLPIFVARQWIRHRTANVNEYSARYSVVEDEVYLPEPAQIAAQAKSNRQGRGESLPEATALRFRERLRRGAEDAFAAYREMLDLDEAGRPRDPEAPGLARELARIGLPLDTYTQWYWKCDLHNLLHFIALRADPHAQQEIRVYAELLMDIVRRWLPLTAAAFEEHRLNAASLSASALAVVRRLVAGETVRQAESGLAAGEWRELMRVLGREAG